MIGTIDGHRVTVTLSWGHWLPRLLGAGAITLGRRILFKRRPTDRERPAAILLAHELVHVAQRQRLGLLKYLGTALWQFLRYRTKAKRPIEAQAYAEQQAVLDQTHPTIRFDVRAVLPS